MHGNKEKLPKITEIIEEKDLNENNLLDTINKLISTSHKENSIKNNNNPNLLNLIHEII